MTNVQREQGTATMGMGERDMGGTITRTAADVDDVFFFQKITD